MIAWKSEKNINQFFFLIKTKTSEEKNWSPDAVQFGFVANLEMLGRAGFVFRVAGNLRQADLQQSLQVAKVLLSHLAAIDGVDAAIGLYRGITPVT